MDSYQSPPSGSPYTAPTNSLATVSLVLGILGLSLIPFLGSIGALVTGYMAKNEIRRSMGAQSGEGLATAGQVLGWIGVGLGLFSICIIGVVFAVPMCLIPLGLMAEGQNWMIPTLFSLF